MANNPKLSVEISADVSGVDKGINTAVKSVETGSKKIAAASNDISKSLAKSAAASAKSGQAIATGANQATLALSNLGRVAQDAPFGFIGIQNNLNPLLESFQRLRAESGSNVSALKALGSSLIGAGGVGLALSAVTAIVTFSQMGFRAWTGTTKDAKKAAEEYAETLGQVREVQLKGAQNAQKELTDVKLLFKAYQDGNLPLERRKQAYDKLQKDYPAYFANLQFEEKAGLKTTAAYNALTQSILASARARSASDKIAENSKRQLEDQEKLVDLEREQIKNQAALDRARKNFNKDNANLTTVGVSTNTQSELALAKAQVAVNQNLKERQALVTDYNILQQRNNDLSKIYLENVEKGALNTDKLTRAEERLNKVRLSQNIGGVSVGGGQANISNQLQGIGNLAVQQSEALQRLRNEFAYTGEEIGFFVANYGVSIENLLLQTENLNKGLDSILNGGIVNTVTSAFEAIGTALAEGANVGQAVAKSMLSSVGGMLVQLGELAISVGVGLIGIKAALKSLNPVLAIAAGASLIALGSMFKSGANSIGNGNGSSKFANEKPIRGFATGGYNLMGGMALVGERGPELVNLPTGSSVHNNMKTNRILAGNNNNSISITGGLKISMRELVVSLDAERKRMERYG